MKTHYDLLGVLPEADAHAIRRAFRSEIARYHPDKVQHLGQEFQQLAEQRAARLTEAYRVLMDTSERSQYDAWLQQRQPPSSPPAGARSDRFPATEKPARDDSRSDRRVPQQSSQAATSDLLRRAVLARVREAVSAVGRESAPPAAFDAVFEIAGRRGLFRRSEPAVRMVVRTVSQVDPACVEESWSGAQRLSVPNEQTCLVLLGNSVAPAGDLAASVTSLRRRSRGGGPIVVPVDLRTWEALVPPNTPPVVRRVLDNLRSSS